MLLPIQNDCIPTNKKSLVVCEFLCRCQARYVGLTTQRLVDRMKQHILKVYLISLCSEFTRLFACKVAVKSNKGLISSYVRILGENICFFILCLILGIAGQFCIRRRHDVLCSCLLVVSNDHSISAVDVHLASANIHFAV